MSLGAFVCWKGGNCGLNVSLKCSWGSGGSGAHRGGSTSTPPWAP